MFLRVKPSLRCFVHASPGNCWVVEMFVLSFLDPSLGFFAGVPSRQRQPLNEACFAALGSGMLQPHVFVLTILILPLLQDSCRRQKTNERKL